MTIRKNCMSDMKSTPVNFDIVDGHTALASHPAYTHMEG